jgi:hypothetical protein
MENNNAIQPRMYYKYAEIDLDTGECIGVMTRSHPLSNPALIPISVDDNDYIGKYYLNGSWYEDAAGTIPWTEPTA